MKKTLLIFITIFMIICTFTGCQKQENRVVIYSSMEEERNQALIEQLKTEFPDLDVVVQHIATGNCAAKIKNEGSNTEADIILGLATSYVRDTQDNFADISNFDTSNYLENVNNTKNYLIWEKYTMTIIIDKNYFDKNNLPIPHSYEDLLNPLYKDLIAMSDPKTSGTGYGFFLNAVNVMGEDQAVEYFKKLKENIREFSTSGSGPTNLLKQGEVAIALGMVAQGVHAINEGYDFEIVPLDTGVVYNTCAYGIIKGKEDNENVQRVFDWLIHSFNKYDKEHFMPSKILKDQHSQIPNYPDDLQDGDMTGIESTERMQELLTRWAEING
ncbi:MAG: extracellular solute-binding protein [Erysipelotrichia bacterium]|nr:extracellular solute-binding protein [Erysipelotrichia bacterium]